MRTVFNGFTAQLSRFLHLNGQSRAVYILTLVCLVVVLFPCREVQCSTYYVDFSSGNDDQSGLSATSPFKHCPGDVNAGGVAASTNLLPGDTVRFKGGVKYVLGKILLKWSGKPGEPITYDGATWGGARAVLTDNYGRNNTSAFQGEKVVRNVRINGFEFFAIGGAPQLPPDQGKPVPRNPGIGIDLRNGCENISIENCYFHELGYWFNKKPMEGNSISGGGIIVIDCRNMNVSNCEFSRVSVGCEFIARDSISGLTVSNCSFHDSLRWCIDIAPASSSAKIDDVNIHDCRFYDYHHFDKEYWSGYGEWPHTDGIFYRCDFGGVSFGYNVNFYNNVFYQTVRNGGGTASIYITEGPSANVFNNVFMHSGKGRTVYLMGGRMPGSPNPQIVNIVNNTFYESYQAAIYIGDNGKRPVETVNVKNNVFYDAMEGSGNNFIICIDSRFEDQGWSFDHNCYYSKNTDGHFIKWGDGPVNGGMAAMKAHGWEANGIAVDPLFVDISHGLGAKCYLNDLRLRPASPARNKGACLGQKYQLDKDGFSRPAGGNWDMGAFAYRDLGKIPPPTGLRILSK